MTDANQDQSSSSDWFRELLDKLGQQADQMIVDFSAQDPAAIDLVGRVGSLPGKVLDLLVAMRDQLNDESRAALDEWVEEKNQRHREMWALYEEQSSYHRAMLGWREQESSLSRQMREWQEREAQRNREWREYLERSERAFRNSLPPNWNSPEVDFPSLEELEVLQLQDGLPLAWVPPNHVLSELLTCKTSASRRWVIGRESAAILRACLRELRRLRSAETSEWRASARKSALAMKAGHWRAGQALAAIALDTAADEFVRSSYKDATKQSRDGKGKVKVATLPGSSEDSLPTWRDVDYPRALLVLHSIYGAFTEFDLRGGEAVPTQFTRHGTVHSISRRQYSKPNALIALMHIVGLLCLIEDE